MDAPLEKPLVNTHILINTLKCVQCKKYLSILPVKVYPDESVKCGRCSSANDAGIDLKVYEHIVENLKFPCINRYEGCTELLIPKDMKIHEENCIKSKVPCPICNEHFTECSLLVVEHVKEKHPEMFIDDPSVMLNINLNKKNLELIYLSINASLDHKAKIIKTFFNDTFQGLIVYWADIGKNFQPGNFELINVENKTIHQTCNGYSQIDLNEFPGHVVICKINFESTGNNKKEIVSKNSVIPKPAPILVNPVLQAAFSSAKSDKTLNMELEFPNIFLLSNEFQNTELLIGGTTWYFGIRRYVETTDFLNLQCYLKKNDDGFVFNKYSFKLNGTIGITTIPFSTAEEMKIEEVVTDKIFGKRPDRKDIKNFMQINVRLCKNGFNPQIADLTDRKYCTKISLNLQLTAIHVY